MFSHKLNLFTNKKRSGVPLYLLAEDALSRPPRALEALLGALLDHDGDGVVSPQETR